MGKTSLAHQPELEQRLEMATAWATLLQLALSLPTALVSPTHNHEVHDRGAQSAPVVHLHANPAAVADFGSLVITWKSAATGGQAREDFQPMAGDFISYSCGPTSSVEDDIFRCDVFVNGSTGSRSSNLLGGHPPQNTGQGGCRFFALVNLRCDYNFIYVRNNTGGNALTVLGNVTVPVTPGRTAPSQGHLSFGDDVDEMFVSWVSGSKVRSEVRYGLATGGYTFAAETYEIASTYEAAEACNSPANTTSQSYWRFPGYFHHVLLPKLVPFTMYYYVYGNKVDGWSDERSFLSRPALNTSESLEEVRFLGYGDQDWDEPGSVQTAALALRDVVEGGYDHFLLHFGDLSYGEGDVSDWDHWATQVEPYAARVPCLVGYGNHADDYLLVNWMAHQLLPMRSGKLTGTGTGTNGGLRTEQTPKLPTERGRANQRHAHARHGGSNATDANTSIAAADANADAGGKVTRSMLHASGKHHRNFSRDDADRRVPVDQQDGGVMAHGGVMTHRDDGRSFSPPGVAFGSDSNGECGLAMVCPPQHHPPTSQQHSSSTAAQQHSRTAQQHRMTPQQHSTTAPQHYHCAHGDLLMECPRIIATTVPVFGH
jgi:hypothetical protein